jgi:DNA polymerase-3 subunit gamma/tau
VVFYCLETAIIALAGGKEAAGVKSPREVFDMVYHALYRQWRPQTFAEVVGQPHIVRTLQNMLEQRRIHHAFLFCGPRGTGKTTMAKILAKALNCREGGPTAHPCLNCSSCLAINEGRHMDVLEIDGASNRGIDEIRELRDRVKFAPAEGGYKVYIIDEVHMLTTEAFNALLKTLEEPPERVIFVFATTEPHRLPQTILSRCQRFDFRRLGHSVILDRLLEVCEGSQLQAERSALSLIAEAADGGLRDALAILDQVGSYVGGAVITVADVEDVVGLVPNQQYTQILCSLAGRDLAAAFNQIDELIDRGKEIPQIISGFIRFVRNYLLYLTGATDISPEDRECFQPLAQVFKGSQIISLVDLLIKAEKELRFVSEPKILLELALYRFLEALGQEPLKSAIHSQTAVGESLNNRANGGDDSSDPLAAQIPPAETETAAARVSNTDDDSVPATRLNPAEPLTLQKLKQAWPQLLDRMKHEEPALTVKLSTAEVMDLQDGVVTIQVEKALARRVIETDRALIEHELQREFGQPLRLRCTQSKAKPAAEVAPPVRQVDITQMTLSEFEGQVVEKNNPKGARKSE